MNYERLKTEYLCYLMNRAQIYAGGNDGYLKLCEKMMNTEFFPIIEMDENRICECRQLREDFAEGYEPGLADILNGILFDNGSMMELFVVLAETIQYDLAESKFEAGTGKWFNEILQNSGLYQYTNERFANKETDKDVGDILATINFRKFDWDGEGGLFPLRFARQDQRNVELAIQMNYYIEENYDIC